MTAWVNSNPDRIKKYGNVLKQLEDSRETEIVESEQTTTTSNQPKIENIAKKMGSLAAPQLQLSIFDAHSEVFDDIRSMLSAIDINRLTPVEALLKLNDIKEKLK